MNRRFRVIVLLFGRTIPATKPFAVPELAQSIDVLFDTLTVWTSRTAPDAGFSPLASRSWKRALSLQGQLRDRVDQRKPPAPAKQLPASNKKPSGRKLGGQSGHARG